MLKPFNDLFEVRPLTYSPDEISQRKQQGLIHDSTGGWFDPSNSIDRLFIDW